jgi:hypothetical protein
MLIEPLHAWKLVVAIVLGVVILLSAFARAPRKAVPKSELRRLVVAAILLYAVGAAASLTGHTVLAAVVYAGGISVCALAAWLSRGSDSDWPPGWDVPEEERPPPDPDALPAFDWQAFEREFREYASRQPAGAAN